jgi:hypothetical protein
LTAKRWRPAFDHLEALTDGRGLVEHDCAGRAEPPQGYSVRDAARGLVVTTREPHPDPRVHRLSQCYLDFVLAAVRPDGTCHDRMNADGSWPARAGTGDGWGRALWALGVAAAGPSDFAQQQVRALSGFRLAARQRSSSRPAMAFAALGAGALLSSVPRDPTARGLVRDAVQVLAPAGVLSRPPRPDPRLHDANGVIAEALLVAGDVLPDKDARGRGLELLAFLLRIQTRDGRLSASDAEHQPTEAAALADACASAYRITGDPRWLSGVSLAWRWFLGENDSRTPMFDAATGAGYDGLSAEGRDPRQGAESTLAMLSTAQHARRIQELR